MDFFFKWELMGNTFLVCLHLPRQPYTEDSGSYSVTVAFIYFKLCVYMYINLFINVFIYLFLGWLVLASAFSICYCCAVFSRVKNYGFKLTGNKKIIIFFWLCKIFITDKNKFFSVVRLMFKNFSLFFSTWNEQQVNSN